MKENRSVRKKPTAELTEEERRILRGKYMRRRQLQQRRRLFRCIALILLAVVAAVLWLTLHRTPLKGKWDLDGVTTYAFYAGGKGELILPDVAYEFTYTAKDGQLTIDFQYTGAKDAQYTYRIKGDTLTLSGGNATTTGTYVLTRIQ